MSLFVETIKVLNGEVESLSYHQARVDETLSAHDKDVSLDLKNILHVPGAMKTGLVKCKLVYDKEVRDIEYSRYKLRHISSLQIVRDDEAEYSYKYHKRSNLDRLYAMRKSSAEIIIVKGQGITDAYYYNLAFMKDEIWYTPDAPLLKGTKRARLLSQGLMLEKSISLADVKDYSQVSLINAMTELGEIVLPIDSIRY